MKFQIEQGITAPPARVRKYRGMTAALRRLPVGDFYLDLPKSDGGPSVRSAASAAKIKIRTRTVTNDDGEQVTRVWKVE